jgi:glycosyltransferase involved in cell wall biosynthesis
MALKVLEVFEPLDGGVAEHVRLLSAGLVPRGFEVVVAARPDARPRAGIEAAGARFAPLEHFVGDMVDARRDRATLRALRGLLREERPDVVHLHSQKAGLLGRVAARTARVPAVYTPNSLIHRFMREPDWTHHTRRAYLNTLWMERVLGQTATAAFVGVSEEERDAAVADRLVPARRAHVIRNGVTVDDAVPADPDLLAHRGDGPLVGFLAGLRIQKGLPVLLDALELLAARADGGPRAAICGSGELEDEVRARIAAGPLAATTIHQPFSGRVEPHLRAFDVFVLPSYFEGLPLIVLEAMACGLPVVATDAGGTAEAVLDGVTGFVVPRGDARAVADAVERLVADPELRRAMGEAGRARHAEHFGAARMVDETAALYAMVARGRRDAS